MSRQPESTDTLENLPIKKLNQKECNSLFRVASTKYETPINFSTASKNRWTPLDGVTGVCYFSASRTGAIAETICRDAAYLTEDEKVVSGQLLCNLTMYEITLNGPLNVLDFTVSNLGRYRLDSNILADYDRSLSPPYRYCPAWASHARSLGLAGIFYRSRHAINEHCFALFKGAASISNIKELYTLDHPHPLAILEDEFDWGIN